MLKSYISQNKYFLLVASICFITLLIFSLDSGINQDDRFHIPQGVSTMKWYTSFGEDKSFMIRKDEGGGMAGNTTYDYGVLLEMVNNIANNALGNVPSESDYHRVRHMVIAVFGFIGLFFAGMIGKYLINWQAGAFIMFLLLFTPRFAGHATFNPKDLPFAIGYISTAYFIIRFINEIKNPRWITAIGLAVTLGIALSARIGGLLLIIYAFIFTGIAIVTNKYLEKKENKTKKSKKRASSSGFGMSDLKPFRNLLLISLAGYSIGLLFWPYGFLDPIGNPLSVLKGWTKFRTSISLLFEGDLITSKTVPWTYIPKYLVITTPIVILIGYLLSIWMLIDKLKSKKLHKAIGLVFLNFIMAFPIFYVIFKDSVLYDGFRHMLFTLAPLVTLGGLGLFFLYQKLGNKYIKLGFAVLVFAGMIRPIVHIVNNPTVAYVYFNPLTGGNKGAFGNYETDYWGLSVKDAVTYLREEGLLDGATEENPVMIGSNFAYPVSIYVEDLRPEVKRRYVTFRNRYDKDWDYGIFVGRFIDGSHLRSGRWPSSRAIHTIDAGGVPVCAIYQNLDKYPSKGIAALRQNNFQEAISNLEKEVEMHPDNEIAWGGLGQAYEKTGRTQDAENAYQNALAINPEDRESVVQLGLLYLNSGRAQNARNVFLKQLELNPLDANAYYYLAVIEYNSQQLNNSFNYVQKAIELNPGFRQAYVLLANIYEATGNKAQADNIRRQLQS